MSESEVELRRCKKCQGMKEVKRFPLNKTRGREYRKSACDTCDNSARRKRPYQSSAERLAKNPQFKSEGNARAQRYRRNPKNRARIIVTDTRRSDKSKGRNNDLDVEWVTSQIESGCQYCGERDLLMTLDRIDNRQGHLKENVTAACSRCNYLRRDMPFQAWMMLVDSIRLAREIGAFGDWLCFRTVARREEWQSGNAPALNTGGC